MASMCADGWLSARLICPLGSVAAVPVPDRTERRFVLRLTAGNGAWGLVLLEDTPWGLDKVAKASPAQARLLRGAVTEAVAADGYETETVGPHRKRPFNLTQAQGVRLALQILASVSLRDVARRSTVVGTLAAMSDEECLYWFAKARGADGSRALRALRLLLAGD